MEIYPVCFFLYYTPTPLYKSITVCVTDNIIVISKCFNLCVCVFVCLCVCPVSLSWVHRNCQGPSAEFTDSVLSCWNWYETSSIERACQAKTSINKMCVTWGIGETRTTWLVVAWRCQQKRLWRKIVECHSRLFKHWCQLRPSYFWHDSTCSEFSTLRDLGWILTADVNTYLGQLSVRVFGRWACLREREILREK